MRAATLWRRPPALSLLGLLLLLVSPRSAAGFASSLDSDFTFTLPAGRKECFFQPMHSEASLEIEYQVSEEGSAGKPVSLGASFGTRGAAHRRIQQPKVQPPRALSK